MFTNSLGAFPFSSFFFANSSANVHVRLSSYKDHIKVVDTT
jgi:hypothetical protein